MIVQGIDPPAEVLDDVASVTGAQVTLQSPTRRRQWGCHARPVGRKGNAVLKAVTGAHPDHLDETLRARYLSSTMRRRGYPTPAWLGAGPQPLMYGI